MFQRYFHYTHLHQFICSCPLPPEKNYGVAIEYYTEAIKHNPFVAALYSNRSFAYLKTEYYGYALTDADKALEVDSKYIKVRTVGCIV